MASPNEFILLSVLILISSGSSHTPTKNKPTKPIFPNFVLPSTQNKQYGGQSPPQGPPSGLSNPAPCPDPSGHFHPAPPLTPPSQYYQPPPPQQFQAPPPQQFQQPQQPNSYTEKPAPIPELFRKPPTAQPSIFQKRPPPEKPTAEKPEGSSTPIPRFKEDSPAPPPGSNAETAPAKDELTTPPPPPPGLNAETAPAEDQLTTPTPPPRLTAETAPADDGLTTPPPHPPANPTTPPRINPPANKQNELFPRIDKPLKDRNAKKLDFKGLPEPSRIRTPVSSQQQPQPQFQPQPVQYDNQKPVPSQKSSSSSPAITYKIAVVADLGRDAKVGEGRFKSFLKDGTLQVQKSKEDPYKYNVTIDLNVDQDPYVIESRLNHDNEGLELSTLNIFNGKLYSCDDETGIVYELKKIPAESDRQDAETAKDSNSNADSDPPAEKNSTYVAVPWIILSNEGENSGFRCEWATVKDEHLWIGSTGILVRKSEEVNELDKTRQGIKKVSPGGVVEHMDWTRNYEKISEAIGLPYHKGFAVHEAVAWSDILQRWLFTPRRISKEKYDKKDYGKRGGNTAIFADDNFEDFKMEHVGRLLETAGFTSIKFIPGTEDQLILALKAGFDPVKNLLMSTLEVFDVNGETVTPETSIGKGIYAGVEFI